MFHLYSCHTSEGKFSWTDTSWKIFSGQRGSLFPSMISLMGFISTRRSLTGPPHQPGVNSDAFPSPPHSSNLCYLLSPVPHPRNIHQRLIYNPCPQGAHRPPGRCWKMLYESYVFMHSFNRHAWISLSCCHCNGDCVRSWGSVWEAKKT